MSQATSNNLSISDREAPLFILLDGHSLAFRAYYAFSNSRSGPLITSAGVPTSICFGFLNSLLQVLDAEQPQLMAVAFDRSEPTFRHQADPNYKSNRTETPEDFIPDILNLQQLLTALNLTIATKAEYEADDILGTLARQASEAGYRVKIVSGDRDLFQLVDDNKNIGVLYLDNKALKSSSKNYLEFDRAAVVAKMNITPEQIVDYKALCGDPSDCIPGVKGIGDKTAVKLLNEYGSLEAIYQNIDKIKGAVKKKLETGKDDALHSQYLAQIHLDTPVNITLEECKLKGFDADLVIPLLKELELNKAIASIDRLQTRLGGEASSDRQKVIITCQPSGNSNGQLSLFGDEDTVAETEPVKPEVFKPKLNTQVIDTETKLQELIATLEKYTDIEHPVAWDTETTALDTRDAELVGIGCCWGETDSQVAYIPLNHTEGKQLDKQQVLSALKPILESTDYPKALQNAKFDRLVLHHQGIELAGVVFDTMLASYVLNPETTHNLGDLSERYGLEIAATSYKDLGIGKGQTIANLDIAKVADYCGLDTYATYYLVGKLKAELKQYPDLEKLLLDIEQPLEPVLAKMETTGVRLDIEYLKEFSQKLDKDLQEIEAKTYDYAGEEFNLGSPKQLSEILFDRLNLDRKKSRKTKTGYSTNQAVLEKLKGDHPIIDTMLEYRTLAKLKSTYVDALPALVRQDTNRVHTDFNQAVTATGRLSSSNPNLQNIPIRTEFSRQIRKAFIPQDDWLLVAADYSQIELRILAHLSQEPVLVEAYRNSRDVHSVTAQLLFEKEKITAEERRLGKIINFGVIYGMGAQRFARESGFKAEVGKQFIEKYRQKYGKVFAYLEGVKKQAIALGYVTTILGRRRYVNLTSDSLRKLKGSDPQAIDLVNLNYGYSDMQILRAAANAPIQGSSADIIKIAMIKLHDTLAKYKARLLLQVHDELVLEVPPDEWLELQPLIISAMEDAVSLSIPLLVEVHAGKNWMEAK
ncbi:DNA polymerase I [Myxosarcina sp. GI1]|uniref:DNA polymerase I n=1 Tax=Myxosarcina sp. GI1 TaxID=1541065 RepID=UPI00068A83C8|nr:DNA polymerase I [Myxosarcina sp. GI1]